MIDIGVTEMGALETDLYLDGMDLRRCCLRDDSDFLGEGTSLSENRKICLDECPHLIRQQQEAFRIALEARDYLTASSPITVPQPIDSGLIPMNEPKENDLVLVSANNSLTFGVLATVWAQGITPAYLLLIDCLGNTVDMAMVFGEFKPEKLKEGIDKSGLKKKVAHRRLIVPGLTAPSQEDFEKATIWQVEVGPICAAELPLFLGDRWMCL